MTNCASPAEFAVNRMLKSNLRPIASFWVRGQIAAAIFFASAVAVLGFFLYKDGDFIQSIVPELFGFCLEGAFFVFLFSFLQERRIRHETRERQTVLKSFIRNSLAVIFVWLGPPEGGPALERALDRRHLDELIADLQNRVSFHDVSRDFIRRHVEDLLPTAHHMIPVAASLGAIHMNGWIMVVNSLRGIQMAANEQQEISAVVELLKAVQLFDRAAL